MRHFISVAIILVAVYPACSLADTSWSAKMQQLSQVLPELLVDVSKENSLQDHNTLARVKEYG
ncbi:MAG: hypothetical protein R3B54_07635 [Bdellovibrionota bacterium]